MFLFQSLGRVEADNSITTPENKRLKSSPQLVPFGITTGGIPTVVDHMRTFFEGGKNQVKGVTADKYTNAVLNEILRAQLIFMAKAGELGEKYKGNYSQFVKDLASGTFSLSDDQMKLLKARCAVDLVRGRTVAMKLFGGKEFSGFPKLEDKVAAIHDGEGSLLRIMMKETDPKYEIASGGQGERYWNKVFADIAGVNANAAVKKNEGELKINVPTDAELNKIRMEIPMRTNESEKLTKGAIKEEQPAEKLGIKIKSPKKTVREGIDINYEIAKKRHERIKRYISTGKEEQSSLNNVAQDTNMAQTDTARTNVRIKVTEDKVTNIFTENPDGNMDMSGFSNTESKKLIKFGGDRKVIDAYNELSPNSKERNAQLRKIVTDLIIATGEYSINSVDDLAKLISTY